MAESSKFPPEFPQQTVSELVLDAFAQDEAGLRAALRDRETDLETYRELAKVALQEVARLTTQIKCLKRAYYALRDETRRERGR